MPRVAIVGPGAIGLAVAFALQQTQRHELVVCARRHLDRLTVSPPHGSPKEILAPIVTSPDEVGQPVDWIVLATKAHQTPAALPWLSALSDSSTRIAILQNGIRHEERVRAAVDESRLVPTVVWFPAHPDGPGQVVLKGNGRLIVPVGPTGESFADLFVPSIVSVTPVPDFHTEAWRKLCMNAVAALMALAGRRVGMYARPDVRDLALALAAECAAVGRADHARLPDSLPAEIVDEILSKPSDRGSSILWDRLAGRTLEWEARNGVIIELGKRHGIATHISDVIVPLLAAFSDGAEQPNQ